MAGGLANQLHAQPQRLDCEVQALVASEGRLSQGSTLLQAIAGIRPQSAALLAAPLDRIEFANADALVAYGGLDSRPCDSRCESSRSIMAVSPSANHFRTMRAFSAAGLRRGLPRHRATTAARRHDMAEGANPEGQMVADYRALRATVLRLWSAASSVVQVQDLEDVTRFNEAVDQAIAESSQVFVAEVDRSRDLSLAY